LKTVHSEHRLCEAKKPSSSPVPLEENGVQAVVFAAGLAVLALTYSFTYAQGGLRPATYNFTGFSSYEKRITPALLKNTPAEWQQHPEFGINPYRTPCDDCVELVQRRDLFSRYYIASDNPRLFYVQQSYFRLHYPDERGFLRTADPRLRPDAQRPGVYSAPNQPVPTHYDRNQHQTFIITDGFSFGFNNKLSMYWMDKNGRTTKGTAADFQRTTVGESGVMTSEAWKGVDVRQVFDLGSVETDFILNEKPDVPSGMEWLVFEDVVELPENCAVKRSSNGVISPEGFWTGDLLVTREGEWMVKYKKSLYYDGYGIGINGFYDIEKRGQEYAVKVLVPVTFLSNPQVKYPVYVDPFLYGWNSIGHFIDNSSTITPLTFSRAPQTCDWLLTVRVPGKCELVDALVDIEYRNPTAVCAQPDPICEFFDVRQWVQGPCFLFGSLQCNPAVAPYLGTCTTDPTKVPGARALSEPRMVTCITPQCSDYYLDFTLKNQTLQCPEICDSNCAAGSFFAVTVVGRTIENLVAPFDINGNLLGFFDTICAGEPVQLTAFPDWGVPHYLDYLWIPSGLRDSVSIVYPEVTTIYQGIAYDSCGMSDTASLTVNVKPAPPADAGDNTGLCDGSPPLRLGGSPTAPPGSVARWSALPPSAINFISDTTASNPLVFIPDTGRYVFIVKVEDSLCFRYDTVEVAVYPNPSPVIIADTTRACANDTITLSVSQTFTAYHWSTNENAAAISVLPDRNYSVTVTDANGCTGTGSAPQIMVLQPLSFDIFPDAAIELGDSIALGASIDLTQSPVDSFFWFPGNYLSCTDCTSPVALPPASQVYSLTVISTDSCVATESLTIRVIPPESYVIPSAFSPNHDGLNDKFYILKASGVTVKEFKVFNRWGQLLHDDATKAWDGFFKGEPQDIGAYTYLFVLQFFDGREVKVPGTVTLVR